MPKMSGAWPTSFQAPFMRVPLHSVTAGVAAAAPSQLIPHSNTPARKKHRPIASRFTLHPLCPTC
jgi:hypothetical protein